MVWGSWNLVYEKVKSVRASTRSIGLWSDTLDTWKDEVEGLVEGIMTS